MKHAKYRIENKNVEVYNSFFGVESILVNCKKVSEGFSWFGKDHPFKIGDNNYRLKPYLSFLYIGGVGVSIYKNGLLQKEENIVSVSDKRKMFLRTALSIALRLAIGGFLGLELGRAVYRIFEMAVN
ncbi:hypothetical protein [Zobellia alginiliquefaciens]|uniref:hypothetical protein n=1 Tax=Zobellia alginiliquefaciens TaxID=3032586 RepID=UPI0023E354AF|nr:hypothetical protein [Zobellia alginiliquefaciens]